MSSLAHAEHTTTPEPQRLRTLILNADYQPLSTWPLSLVSAEDAIHAFYRDRVVIVENWEGAFFRSPSVTIPVPKVAALRHYAPINARPKFCRRSILLFWRYRCAFCNEPFPSHELTFDHVIPRAKGGTTCWENIVAACLACNAKKADGAKMKPLRAPRQPTTAELLRIGLEFLPADLKEDFGSHLYWSTPLDP